MLLAGFAGIYGFRKRLSNNKFFVVLCLAAILTGLGSLLNGCGGGGSNSNSNNNTTPQVATPTFSPIAGTYSAAQTVTISDSTAGSTIYYTIDGTTPTTSSTRYATPITVASTQTVQAIAIASGYTNSAVASALYTISFTAAATPTFSPVAGTYTSAQTVTISDATTGAVIYYTTDGSTPTISSTKYSSPITVSTSETIQAIATASGYTTSAVASAAYVLNLTNVVTVTTNANGNITSIPPANASAYATFAYNNANRVASVTGSPLAATFVYDWAGQRFSKTNPGASGPILYSYAQNGVLIAENNIGSVTDYIYADGRPIAVLNPTATPAANQIAYIVADKLGTPQLASNSSGTTVWNTYYQPFGTTGVVSGTITQNLRLPGQYSDVETGFNYNLYRDYMPNLGRYQESDPVGLLGGKNSFAYVAGNPSSFRDPQGLWVGMDDLVFTVGGAVLGVAGQGIALGELRRGGSGWGRRW